MSGKVYVASMNMRGKWAEPTIDNYIKVNVTSAQAKKSRYRLDFSPMQEIVGGYKGYWNFESYWQSGKVFEDIPIETTKKWWKELKQAKRRYPNSKGKKVLYSLFDGNSEKMNYITSRKKIYVPEYYNLIKDRKTILELKSKLKDGTNIIIYDFDGPRDTNGQVQCIELSSDLLKEKINDNKFSFGHGYIVGATISDINPDLYIES